MTQSAALEAARFGVRVNAVAPSPTETAMLTRFTGTAERKAALATGVPLGRVGEPDEIARAIVEAVTGAVEQTVATFGRLDVLVNNAGTAIPKPFEETTLDEMERVIDINVRGTLVATQAALKHMKPGGQPGPIDTDLNPAAGDWAVPQKAATALDRYGHVDEVAALVAFVAGPESSYITGANLTVDGGTNA
jgi:NAD(P)-dependent dehydrogenase (short-subunit alcohol dehydrogenase family)